MPFNRKINQKHGMQRKQVSLLLILKNRETKAQYTRGLYKEQKGEGGKT